VNNKQPINGVQTRVVQDEGYYYAQLSTDGLTWFPLTIPQLYWGTVNQATAACLMFGNGTYIIPVKGEVVWQSNKRDSKPL